MPLQSSGAISLSQIQAEFGGSNPISLSEYYGAASGIPSSGTISMNQFYGKSAVQPFDFTFHTCNVKHWSRGPTRNECTNYYQSLPNYTNTSYFRVQSNGFQEYNFTAGTYNVELVGPRGGDNFAGKVGGHGAKISGQVYLNGWTTIVVGTRGGEYQYTAGGGGATMLWAGTYNSRTLKATAGGGGGGGNSGGNGKNAAYNSNSGVNGYGGAYTYGGTSGNGGGQSASNTSAGGWGVGGSGWSSAGRGYQYAYNGAGWQYSTPPGVLSGTSPYGGGPTNNNSAFDFSNSGSCRGAPGGWPGGGGGQCNGGGGGAGYSGGGGGGGGGGSYWGGLTSYGYSQATASDYLYDGGGYIRIWQ